MVYIDFMSILITTKEAVELTGIPSCKFSAVMVRAGIKPIDFGRGRGNGLRWPKDDVINAVVCGLLGKTEVPRYGNSCEA